MRPVSVLVAVATAFFSGSLMAQGEDTGTPVGSAADASLIRFLNPRAFPPPNIWVGHFAEYRHGTHQNFVSCGQLLSDGSPFPRPLCADTITEFVAINGSEHDYKVRLQGLDSNGTIVFERDTGVPAGATRSLLPSKALQHGVDLGETFIVTSYGDLVLFGNSFTAFGHGFVDIEGNDIAFALAGNATSKRQIDLVPIDCGQPHYEFFCDTPTRLTPWNALANTIPGD